MPEFPVLSKESASFDINAAGDKATFSFAYNAKIVACGLIVRGNDAGGATVAFDKRVLAGSDTGRGAADIGEITIPASNQQGKYLYEDLSDSGIEVAAGDEIVVEVTAEAVTALQAVAVIELLRLHESRANLSDGSAA